MLHPLVERLAEAKVMEIMNFREWENECADSMAAFSGTTDGRSLKEIQRNNLRRKHRNALAEGLPVNHVALYKKRCNENKTFHMLLLKFDTNKKDQHFAEIIEKRINIMPRLLKRNQIKAINAAVNKDE